MHLPLYAVDSVVGAQTYMGDPATRLEYRFSVHQGRKIVTALGGQQRHGYCSLRNCGATRTLELSHIGSILVVLEHDLDRCQVARQTPKPDTFTSDTACGMDRVNHNEPDADLDTNSISHSSSASII